MVFYTCTYILKTCTSDFETFRFPEYVKKKKSWQLYFLFKTPQSVLGHMSAKKYEMKLHVPGLQGIMQNTCDYFYFLSFFYYINYFFWIHIYIYILKLIYEYRAISFVVNHCILHLKLHWSSLARSRCSSISLFVICDRF